MTRRATPLSGSDEYETPDALFHARHARFGFTVDVAAASWNAKLPRFWSKRDSALSRRWVGERGWMNFPYSRGNPLRWASYARDQVLHGAELVDGLGPAATSEPWWQKQVMAPAGRLLHVGFDADPLGPRTVYVWRHLVVEVLFLAGRLRFREQRAGQLRTARASHALFTFIHPSSPHAQTSANRR